MKILSYEYSEHPDSDRHWSVTGLELGPINLLVGRNASGKTRTLNTLHNFAAHLRGEKLSGEGRWVVQAAHEQQGVEIEFTFAAGHVRSERLVMNGKLMVNRDERGSGSIWYSELEKELSFEISTQSLAMVAKRDKKQHPYLEDLAFWADGARIYRFGETMGRESLVFEIEGNTAPHSPYDTRNLLPVARTLFMGEHKDAVVARIKEDMAAIGYAIDGIEWGRFQGYVGVGESRVLLVREHGVACTIPHIYLSQGMFRALAIFMHLNHILLSGGPTCILIDDIGEGLDFARSTALIRRLIQRVKEAKNQDIQLVMTTNDQFVMNAVDLQYWSVIIREGSHCRVLNERNSKKLFDDFRFIGLNNFDFLELEFWKRDSDVDPA